jgi:putative membrane protein
MTRSAAWLLAAGALLFAAVLVSHGLGPVFAALAAAGWSLTLVAAFHALPLLLDAAAICVLFDAVLARDSWRDALLARWAGESANSLMPVGQVAGPVVMVRSLSHRGMPMQNAVAAITVSTTLQGLAQIIFALVGVALLAAQAGLPLHGAHSRNTVGTPLLVGGILLVVPVTLFYLVQRRGLFARSMRAIARFSGKRDWSQLTSRAEAIDLVVEKLYGEGRRTLASFALSLAGWLVGTGEVYLILKLIGCPVGWADALLLESLGQAIRGAAFAVPGALGVQEGGYLLLAPFVGLQPDTALALSLAKRAREILLGLPGLLYLYFSERGWRRRVTCAAAGE